MVAITLKILIILITTIAAMRVMGKSAIVQLTPYDLVTIIIIGTVITEPLVSTSLKTALLELVIIVAIYLMFARLTLNQVANKFFLGEPSILIKHKKIVKENLQQNHISLMQLLSILRAAGYPDIADVEYAILEPTGQLSVIPAPQSRPITLGDLGIAAEYEGLPLALIIDGRIQKENLKLIGKDEKWLLEKLNVTDVREIKDIIFASADDTRNEIYVIFKDGESRSAGKEKHKNHEDRILVISNGRIQASALTKGIVSKDEIEKLLQEENLKLHDVNKLSVTIDKTYQIKKKNEE